MRPQLLSHWIPESLWRLGIAKKIACGYVLAIGIAALGATVGLVIGNHYQEQAQEQLTIARQQQDLLSRLDKDVLVIRSHPQRLVMVMGDTIWFDYERSNLRAHLAQVKSLSAELKQFVRQHPQHLAIAAPELNDLAEQYDNKTTAYVRWSQSLWQRLNPGALTSKDILVAQQNLLAALREDTVVSLEVQFERLTERLGSAIKTAQTQQIQADAQLEAAEQVRSQIMVGTLLGAVIMAIVLAYWTSRAIARPITAVTKVAERVTQESNFELQAPVLTMDEIGILATAFNSLIRNVADYTHALELGQQTLEQRVEERTQELRQTLDNLQQAQFQLVQAEKMSSLGQLVAGVTQEINNPVNFIHGNLVHASQYTQDLLAVIDLYQAHVANPPSEIVTKIDDIDLDFLSQDMPKLLSSMQVGADRIREIVQSLRTFSRLDEADVKDVDLHAGIDSTLMILHNRLKPKSDHPGIQVIKEYGDLPQVECHAGQLNQVFMNILSNAIDALEERSKDSELNSELEHIELETITQPPDQRLRTDFAHKPQISPKIIIRTELTTTANQKTEPAIAIRIADNGPGMADHVRRRIFDPFFTTKPVGKGTGMGMSISYQIVTERHGGTLSCTSKPGEGTEFAIEIPIRQLSPSSLVKS